MSMDKIFTPYYINQSRLFDLYAVLNEGYNEYSEISESVSIGTSSEENKSSEGVFSGFKIFNFGGSINKNNSKSFNRKGNKSEKPYKQLLLCLILLKKDLMTA